MTEWLLTVLWIALFGNFYTIYYAPRLEREYAGTNVSNMKRIVWVDLISALLWLASALFSTSLCCFGLRAKIRGKKEQWKAKRKAKKQKNANDTVNEMERGIAQTQIQDERLPRYDEVPIEGRT